MMRGSSRNQISDPAGASDRQYRRGAIMGMTMAEAFILIAFILLLLLGAWKMRADTEQERVAAVSTLPPDDIQKLAQIASSGADLERIAALAADEKKWRLIDSDELRRVVDAVEDIPSDLQSDLADMVEIGKAEMLLEILEATKSAPEDITLQERLAGIGERLSAARAAEQEMIEDLRETLGATVSGIGGYIDDDGSIVLPDTVLFEIGRDDITPRMREFLTLSCEPWLEVLMRSPARVAGAQIEGHASSEWRSGTSPDQAYLNNLDLSQRRSQAVLNTCLGIVESTEVRSWAHNHLAAVGYSSGRVVQTSTGEEDPTRSRRVVFSADIDSSDLIETVESDVSEGLSRSD